MDNLCRFLYCYNSCVFHEQSRKEYIRRVYENAGFVFAVHKGKLYVDSFVPSKNDQVFDEDEVRAFAELAKLIKEVNTLAKTHHSIVHECKEHGVYFKRINGYLYFEKFVGYEMLTRLRDECDNMSFFQARKVQQLYDEYKKYV